MATSNDVTMDDGDRNAQVHQPFTVEENIEELAAIDKATVELMTHVSVALGALSSQAAGSKSEEGSEGGKKASTSDFKGATDSFLTALHKVDVKMKRQILALEEAGIVSLASGQRAETTGTGIKSSLKPDGKGGIGHLDVGLLNSRGARVERDMEAELWGSARSLLEKGKNENKA